MTHYSRAPEVQKIAGELIAAEDDHEHLRGVWIEYLYRDKARTHGGRVVLGSARKVSGLGAYLYHAATGATDDSANAPVFVVEVAADWWHTLTPKQQRALVDHELCHLGVDTSKGDPELYTRGHDVEEFAAIIRRHGLWKDDLTLLGYATLSAEAAGRIVDAAGAVLDPDTLEALAAELGPDTTVTLTRGRRHE